MPEPGCDYLDTLFQPDLISGGLADLAARQPLPGEADLVRVFAAARQEQAFPESESKQYPAREGIELFSRCRCDLRVSRRVWAEFKHVNSTAYVRRFDKSGHGKEKDLIRHMCMDAAKTETIGLDGRNSGVAIASMLHLGFQDDIRAAGVDQSLRQLAKSLSVCLGTRSFPFEPKQKCVVSGYLDIYLFHRSFLVDPLRTYRIHLKSGERLTVQGNRVLTLRDSVREVAVEIIQDSLNDPSPGGQKGVAVAVFPIANVEAIFDGEVSIPFSEEGEMSQVKVEKGGR